MTGWAPLQGAVGASREDVDFRSLDPGEFRQALHEYQLLVLRGQTLTPASFAEAAARLGTLDVYPFAEPLADCPHVVGVVKEAADESNFGGAWHTDTAYMAEPPAITLLYAVETPATGGDTLFADTLGAFERLSAGMKATLRTLVGHNTAGLVHAADGSYAAVAGQSVPSKQPEVQTESDHPLVIADPGTGRESLFFSLIHTSHFAGMSREDSLPLLEQLHRLVVAAENTTRLGWQPGTLAIWDNRTLQHFPLNDYPGQRREMHRIILKGDRPRSGSCAG